MQDLCILIPTINRKDLMMKALESYSEVMPEVTKLILDNGNQDIADPATDGFLAIDGHLRARDVPMNACKAS